jgi:hypothetical protein
MGGARAIRAAINAKLDEPQRWQGKNAGCILNLLRTARLSTYQPATAIKPIVKR